MKSVPPAAGSPGGPKLGVTLIAGRDGRALVEKLAGNMALSPDIVSEIVDRTDGVPLFVESRDALERLVTEKGIADADLLARYHDAWDHAADRTKHGDPIELRPEDFK